MKLFQRAFHKELQMVLITMIGLINYKELIDNQGKMRNYVLLIKEAKTLHVTK
jgi:hypothetical protein